MSRKASLNPSKLPCQALLRLRGIPGSSGELSVMKNFFYPSLVGIQERLAMGPEVKG
jgi:hypothetical protein